MLSLDALIIAGFLLLNLAVGIYVGKGIKNIQEYAVGHRKFSTATLAATLIATWWSGGAFMVSVSETYAQGLWFSSLVLGDMIALLIVGNIFAPRMGFFLDGSISIAESMGNLFGKHVRIVTAIAAITQSIGMVALQIQVFSVIFAYFLGFSSFYAICISTFVVIFYSAWGGIKSVTFTDVIQFITFGLFIPLFLFFVIKVIGDTDKIWNTITTNPLLDYKQMFDIHHPKFWPGLMLFLWFLTPDFDPATFQRMLMTRTTTQMRKICNIAAMVSPVMIFLSCTIGVLVLSLNADLDSQNILMYVLDEYSFNGLRGLTVIGIIAMGMSTADSLINTASVIFAHDLCKPFGLKPKNELFLARIFAIFVGMTALVIVLSKSNALELLLLQSSVYMPIVMGPLVLAIFGFRTSGKSTLFGMLMGVVSIVIWMNIIEPMTGLNGILISVLMNMGSAVAFHHITGQQGGWVKVNKSV
jgi:Na+/proline symporter